MQTDRFLLQLHCGDRPDPDQMPVWNQIKSTFTNKPALIEPVDRSQKVGLWTSTYTPDAEHQSDWLRWCIDESFGNTDKTHWLLEVDRTAHVLHLNDEDDYRAFYRDYGHITKASWGEQYSLLDWAQIARDHDGFHLGDDAVWRFRYKDPDGRESYPFYSWDAESTVWFNWCFKSVTPIEPTPRINWDNYHAPEQRKRIIAALEHVPGAVVALIDAFPEFRRAAAAEEVCDAN